MKQFKFYGIQHHVDPMRYPKIQGQYENQSKNAFNAVRLFGDVVQTMVDIQKGKRDNVVFGDRNKEDFGQC